MMVDTPFEKPRTASAFIALMEEIWKMDGKPAPDGGMIIGWSDWYDEWHDALKVAQVSGWARTGHSKIDGIGCQVYRHFETQEGVKILKDGSGMQATRLVPNRHMK